MKQIVERIIAPTPNFFRKLRNIGLALVAVATAIVTAPVALPAVVLTLAGYLGVAGAVLSAVSQTAVETE